MTHTEHKIEKCRVMAIMGSTDTVRKFDGAILQHSHFIIAIGCKHVDSDVIWLYCLYILKPQNAELSVTPRNTVSCTALIPYSRGYLYWSDVLTDTIYRANMTHTSNRVVLVNTSTDLVGMCKY